MRDAIRLNAYCFTSAQPFRKTWTPQTLFLKTCTGGSYKMNAEYPQLRLSQSRKGETLGRSPILKKDTPTTPGKSQTKSPSTPIMITGVILVSNATCITQKRFSQCIRCTGLPRHIDASSATRPKLTAHAMDGSVSIGNMHRTGRSTQKNGSNTGDTLLKPSSRSVVRTSKKN